MTRIKPRLTPTGEIEADGVLYRIVEPADSKRYSVVRESDGREIGRFALDEVGHEPRREAVDPGALDPELVLAIARLLAQPRGVLPIQ